MMTLVLGASGATGMLLVEQLLNREQKVRVLVRPSAKIPESWMGNDNITVVKTSISGMGSMDMSAYVKDCQTVVCCLGHNLTLKGIYGKPRRLVTDAVRLICEAIQLNPPKSPVAFILMNTTGNRNKDLNEPISFGDKLVMALIRVLVPPQVDNEQAADYLRSKIGQKNKNIEWVAVRPDSLINNESISKYEVYASPIRNPIFNPGKTSRINVGHFMAELIVDKDLWQKWKGQMPVIYNEMVSQKTRINNPN